MVSEKRLIDAIELMKAIRNFRWIGVPNTLKLMFDYLKIIIRDQPTVDAVEVVHGRWIEKIGRAKCSVCLDECWADSAMDYNFCPNCGAKMDGERSTDGNL